MMANSWPTPQQKQWGLVYDALRYVATGGDLCEICVAQHYCRFRDVECNTCDEDCTCAGCVENGYENFDIIDDYVYKEDKHHG